MLVYVIAVVALLITIWYEKRQDLPDMNLALDELEEDQGFNFGKHCWVSYDQSSALAIDKEQEKIVLLRAYKGWQQIDYDELVEYEVREKEVSAPQGGFLNTFKSYLNRNAVYTAISLDLLINNLDCFNFQLKLTTSCNAKAIKKASKEASDICTILKLIRINVEKKAKQPVVRKAKSRRTGQDASSNQGQFSFS